MSSTALAVSEQQTNEAQTFELTSQKLARKLGLKPADMIATFKAQCFPAAKKPEDITNAQLITFISIAHEMDVNPLIPGMMYAYPTQGGGIIPMIGPDGVFKKLSEHPNVDYWETNVEVDSKGAVIWAETIIHMMGGRGPRKYRAYFVEWNMKSNPNWQNRPMHMLGLRSLKQCARQVIHGIPYDEDERAIIDLGHVQTIDPKKSRAANAINAATRPQVEQAELVVESEPEQTLPVEAADTLDEIPELNSGTFKVSRSSWSDDQNDAYSYAVKEAKAEGFDDNDAHDAGYKAATA